MKLKLFSSENIAERRLLSFAFGIEKPDQLLKQERAEMQKEDEKKPEDKEKNAEDPDVAAKKKAEQFQRDAVEKLEKTRMVKKDTDKRVLAMSQEVYDPTATRKAEAHNKAADDVAKVLTFEDRASETKTDPRYRKIEQTKGDATVPAPENPETKPAAPEKKIPSARRQENIVGEKKV